MSWPMVALGEVVSFKGGGTPSRGEPKYWGGDISWATVKDFDDGYLIRATQEFITDEGLENSASNLIPAGTVIIPTRMALGKAAISLRNLAINQDLKAVIPNGSIEPRYLLWYFIANSSKINSMGKGATVKGVTLDQLRKLSFPLPPLPEQRRISAILDKADALRTKRREAIAKLNQLLQSVFLEMFGDPATNPKGWPIVALSIYGNVATGNTPPRSAPENYGTGIEWIKSDNLNTRHDYVTNAEEQLSDVGVRLARVAPTGSVLVTCIAGSLSCIGNSAITDRRVAFNQQINAITPHISPPEFLYFLLKTAKPLIQDASTNGMKGMVNKSKFSAIQLPAPPIELQREFSRSFLEIQKLRSMADAALERQETLFAALHQRAFEGKL